MKSKSLKEKDKNCSGVDIWGLIIKKLEENGQTVDWLAEQVSQGTKTFYWHYSRKRIKTDMLWDISVILDHDFFEYYSEYLQKLMLKKELKLHSTDF
jgi:hypothetical protein